MAFPLRFFCHRTIHPPSLQFATLPPPGSVRTSSGRASRLESPDLSLSTHQHQLLRDCLALGLERSRERLADTPAAGTEICLEAVSSCPLSDFDPGAAGRGPTGDLIAGVMQRFEGRLTGTVLMALEPGDALLWLQRGVDDGDPLARFVDWGSRILAGVTTALGRALQSEVALGEPSLEERPLMAALLATHAPSDTLVLSLHGELGFPVSDLPEIRAPFSIQILLAPKLVSAVLGGIQGDEVADSA